MNAATTGLHSLRAQIEQGKEKEEYVPSIEGTVIDQEGEVIVSAKVVFEDAKGKTVLANTNAQGTFMMPGAPYSFPATLTISSRGFKTQKIDIWNAEGAVIKTPVTVVVGEVQ